MLKSALSDEEFQRVLCIGSHDLDALAQSRTLTALTWKAMRRDVEQHEALQGELQHALEQIARIVDYGESHGDQMLTHVIDALNHYSTQARVLHRRVAENRCRLEDLVAQKQSEILQQCTIVLALWVLLRIKPI